MEKNATMDKNNGMSKANIEWLHKMLYNIKSEMMDEDTDR